MWTGQLIKNKTQQGLAVLLLKEWRNAQSDPRVSWQLGMTHTTRKPKQASLDGGRMKNSSSSGGGQGCLTHGWLLLLLSFLQPHCLLESFLPTAPEHIFIPQQRSVPGSRLNSCSALVGLAQGHPYTPFRAASFFFFLSTLLQPLVSSPAGG